VDNIAFGPFSLNAACTRLLRGDTELDLRPQALHVLKVLIQHSGEYVDYDRMIREAWEGIRVSRHTVAVTVSEVKKALQEYGSWISHRPKAGYRFEVPHTEELVRKGWHFWSHRTRQGIEKALVCFEEAARGDAADFRAYEGISLCYLTLGACGMRSPRHMHPRFLEAHRRAVSLAGLTPELRSDRGHGLHLFERRMHEAEADLLKSHREKPRAANCVRLMMLYAALGRLDEASEVLNEAYTLEPLWPMLPASEVHNRFLRREFDEAVACGQKAVELHPYLQLARVFYAQALEYSGDVDKALEQYRLACVISPDPPWLRALEGTCLARNGRRAEAAQSLGEIEQLRAAEYVDAYYVALLCDALGDRDRAFCELERAIAENSATLHVLDVDPKMDCLRLDPRYRALRDAVFGEPAVPLKRASGI
jgi:tetratricopeptide (TPR) repeat protein